MSTASAGCTRSLVSALVLLLVGCASPTSDSEQTLSSEISHRNARWLPLGENLNHDQKSVPDELSLAGAPLQTPVLAYTLFDADSGAVTSPIGRYINDDWQWLAQPLDEGGVQAAGDSQRHIYVCSGGNGPFVRRWNGSTFAPVGGNIGEETGFKGFRYSVDRCGGIVLDSGDVPIVVWSADVGAKANIVYAARFDPQSKKWQGIGDSNIGGRATDATVGIDSRDRLYVSAYTPGGSYGGGATTRVFTFGSGAWSQLGEDMPNTSDPSVAVFDNTVYLTLHDNVSGTIQVMDWCLNLWHPLPSPGAGDRPALAVSRSGNPVVAYAAGETPEMLQVTTFVRGNWTVVGPNLSDEQEGTLGSFDLSVEAGGRPTVAWTETDAKGHTRLYAKRYSIALP